jgi:SAM-dependent methyltransferase
MASEWFDKAFGSHYRLLYRHRDQEEARACLELLPRLAPMSADGGPVLDLGCGDGRHLSLLAAQGVDAVGLDRSAALLAAARNDAAGGTSLRLVRGDMRRLPLATGAVSSVLSLFTAFGYFKDLEANLQPVQEIARVLRTGGHWFLDFMDSGKVAGELADGSPRSRERVDGPLRISEERRLASDGRCVIKSVLLEPVSGREDDALAWGIEPAGLAYEERVALLTLAELDRMAAGSGLERVASAGDYDGRPLHRGSRWILVYRRGPEEGNG